MADPDPVDGYFEEIPPLGESLEPRRSRSPIPGMDVNPLDLVSWLAKKTTGDLLFPIKRLNAYRQDRAIMDNMARNAPRELPPEGK